MKLDYINRIKRMSISPDEFRKNAVKFGWELWEAKPETSTAEDATVTRSN